MPELPWHEPTMPCFQDDLLSDTVLSDALFVYAERLADVFACTILLFTISYGQVIVKQRYQFAFDH